MRHAVIMAGGAGTRLWPLSRRSRPKQLLRLFDGASLLQLARRRLEGLFEPANIWVITSANYLDLVANELPDIPRENLIGEPMPRDTANAIGLAADLLARRDADATMAVFTADHLISPQDRFAAAIRAGLDAAERHPQALVTFGITPECAHVGYGYVRRGEPVGRRGPLPDGRGSVAAIVYRVAEFKEKPTQAVAEGYLASGDYLWNSGMFAWRVSAILGELERHVPENARTLRELAPRWEQLAGTPEAATRFAGLRPISIDFGVMEKASAVLLVEMACQWLDVGSWSALAATRAAGEAGNVAIASGTGTWPEPLLVNSRNTIVVRERDHLIVALGVSDLIVVHAEDATLICHRDHEQEIRELAKLRQERFGERYE